MQAAFLVPVKAFHLAKQRLRGHVLDTDRNRLARWMADAVLAAIGERPTFVACDDDQVAEWATSRGAHVLWGPGLGLNGAVDVGVAQIADAGFDHVTICHGDLPLPESLPDVARSDTIVLVPDRRGEGTNVVSRPVDVELPASYGYGSFGVHLRLALSNRSNCAVSIRHDLGLSLDFDTVEDLEHPRIAPLARALLGHTGKGDQ